MRLFKWVFTALVLAGGVFLFLAVARGSSEVPASFSVLPGSPVAGRSVLFRDTLEVAGTLSWHWDFGDGETSESASPVHVYRLPGVYPVTLTVLTGSGSRVIKQVVEVSADNTLRLLSGRFEATLSAVDQRTGRTGEGLAIPLNDLFGYFSIPDITANRDNPEMLVKMLDARAIGSGFWVFLSPLTDMDVTVFVKEVPTGIVKTYRKEAGSTSGIFDTSGFAAGAPTPTPTAPGPTPTRTPTPPTPTPTPPSGTTVVNLVASQFQWSFNGGPSSFTMRVGQSYELRISSADVTHGFSRIPSLGFQSDVRMPVGSPITRTITPTAGQVGTHFFSCSETTCGFGHSQMTGSIQVVP